MGGRSQSRTGATGKYRVKSKFYAPPAQFEGCFTSFYLLDLEVAGSGTVTDLLQPEWASMRFFAGQTPVAAIPGQEAISGTCFGVSGPTSLPTRFTLGATRMWGIGFLPLGWARYCQADAADFANRTLDGSEHPVFAKFAPLANTLCDPEISEEQQFDAIVDAMEALARPCRAEQAIIRIHRALIDEQLSSVAEFSESAGVSLRRLERMCQRYFGFTPKLLLRRQRFMRSLSQFMLHRGSKWSEVMDEHYHDQAQFTREFRQFMTMNPSEFAAMPHPFLDSFIEARTRMRGSPAQTLDSPD